VSAGGLGGALLADRIDLVVEHSGAQGRVLDARLAERHLGVGADGFLPLLAADAIPEYPICLVVS
jgi:hypothetical protein